MEETKVEILQPAQLNYRRGYTVVNVQRGRERVGERKHKAGKKVSSILVMK